MSSSSSQPSSRIASRISSRHASMASHSGFLSYSASHRNIIPPHPLSLRPISQATSIAVDSDYETYISDTGSQRMVRKSIQMGNGWRGNSKIKEEDEDRDGEGGSEAESMESLSSRVQRVHDILSDSDASSTKQTRTSISSSFTFSEASTPEGSPLPHYHEPLIYDPDVKNHMLFRSPANSNSLTYEDLPRYTQESASMQKMSTIGPKGPHLFRSLSTSTTSSAHNSLTHLIVPDDFIPPTPVTPTDTEESPSLVHSPATPAVFPPPASETSSVTTPRQASNQVLDRVNGAATPRSHVGAAQQMVRTRSSESEVSNLSRGSSNMGKRGMRGVVLREYEISEVKNWSEKEVCDWVRSLGFDQETVMKFMENDITGNLLTEMDNDVLKQCGIRSWGKRVELLSHITKLKALSNPNGNPIEQFAHIRHHSVPVGIVGAVGSPARPSPRSMKSAPTPTIEPLKPVTMATVSEDDGIEDDGSVLGNPRGRLQPIASSDEEGELTVSTRGPRLNIRKKSRKGRARVMRTNRSRKQISIEPLGLTEVAADSATDGEREYKIYRVVSSTSCQNAMPSIEEARQERRARRSRENAMSKAIPMQGEPSDEGVYLSVAEVPMAVEKKKRTCKKHRHHKTAAVDSNAMENKPQKCIKGDRCAKHGTAAKTRMTLNRTGSLASAGTILIAATPSIADNSTPTQYSVPASASVTRPQSLVAPSVVASSDVLGAIHSKEVKLKEGILDTVSSMDPQESVKMFLVNQHLQHLEERRKSPPPPPTKSLQEMMRAQETRHRSISNASSNPEIAAQAVAQAIQQQNPLRHSTMQQPLSTFLVPQSEAALPGPVLTAPINRARTPALGLRTTGIPPPPASSAGFSPVSRMRSPTAVLRTTTPFSEMDVPIGAPTPQIPEFRNQSQSVPPEFKYRNDLRSFNPGPVVSGLKVAPAPPPPGLGGPSRRMTQSTTGIRPQPIMMTAVDENAEWEDEPTPRSTSLDMNGKKPASHLHSGSTVNSLSGVDRSIRVHSGWMRKRKTHWFRHEWPEHHFVLRGTCLGIHKDQHSAEEVHINMDDYSVACSNSANSKLSAAFKAFKIKASSGDSSKSGIDGPNAFFFQLVPVSDKERKTSGLGGSSKDKKVHYFAVKSRDERIDWMRELMLAKAIKQKKEEGYAIEINGERI